MRISKTLVTTILGTYHVTGGGSYRIFEDSLRLMLDRSPTGAPIAGGARRAPFEPRSAYGAVAMPRLRRCKQIELRTASSRAASKKIPARSPLHALRLLRDHGNAGTVSAKADSPSGRARERQPNPLVAACPTGRGRRSTRRRRRAIRIPLRPSCGGCAAGARRLLQP